MLDDKSRLTMEFWYWWHSLVDKCGIEVIFDIDHHGNTYYEIEYKCELCGKELCLYLEGDQFQTDDDMETIHEIARAMKGKFKCEGCS
jgi:hypothetical protein